MPRPGHIYKEFKAADGTKVTLRSVGPEDLDGLLAFINGLVREKQRDRYSPLYAGFDKKLTCRQEAEWLAERIKGIKEGNVISILAEIDGKIVADGEVTRVGYDDTRHHGQVGLTMMSAYRGKGIGREMIATLVRGSRQAGLRSLEVEFLASNKSARRAYEGEGFRQAGLIPRKIFRNGKYFNGLIMARKL